MRLYDDYPDSIEYRGKIYRLNLSFKSVLASVDVFSDPSISDLIQIETALDNLVLDRHPVDPKLLGAIFTLIFPKEKRKEEPVIDFKQDAAYILATFRQAYGIDLKKEDIHWCMFSDYLKGLPKGTKLREIIEIRQMPIPEPTKYNAKERAAIIRAKSEVAIRKETGIQGALLNLYKMLEAKAKGG